MPDAAQVPVVTLSISDPISADIQAIAKASEAFFTFLATPEGQLACKAWREGTAKLGEDLGKVGRFFEDLFTGKLLK
jgi:hypothetical protein